MNDEINERNALRSPAFPVKHQFSPVSILSSARLLGRAAVPRRRGDMVRQPLQLAALALSSGRRFLLDLPEALGVPVAERGQLRVLGRQARRAVRRPADECGVVDLLFPSARGLSVWFLRRPGQEQACAGELPVTHIGPFRVVVLELAL